MAVEKHTLKISTTGSAGVASGSGILSLPLCELLAIYLDYHASAPATTDVTVKSVGDPATVTLLTRSNSATDGWFYPTVNVHDNAAAAVTGAQAPPVVHAGALSIDVAQADALTDCLVATVYIRV
mgnify:CR=1 FL=1